MNLKQYARKHTTGGITWYMTPYQTLKNQTVSREFNEIAPFDKRDNEETLFVAMESFVLDAEFAADLAVDEQMFAEYWRNRPATLRERWEVFTMVMSTELTVKFFTAWQATRDTMIERVEVVAEGDHPNE